MNRTEIKWENPEEGWKLNFTWNPLYGCKRNCWYCYARRLHEKYQEMYKKGVISHEQYKKPFNELQVFENRFEQPTRTIMPSTIFALDMGEIAAHKRDDVQRVIDVARRCHHHRFLFLTKEFCFYSKYEWPLNAWLGITMEYGELRHQSGFDLFKKFDHPNKFISIEPIMGMFDDVDLTFAQWIIVGKMNLKSEKECIQPEERWVKSIRHHNIFFKDFTTRALRVK